MKIKKSKKKTAPKIKQPRVFDFDKHLTSGTAHRQSSNKKIETIAASNNDYMSVVEIRCKCVFTLD